MPADPIDVGRLCPREDLPRICFAHVRNRGSRFFYHAVWGHATFCGKTEFRSAKEHNKTGDENMGKTILDKTMMLRLPLATTGFSVIRNSKIYVDKTSLIMDLALTLIP